MGSCGGRNDASKCPIKLLNRCTLRPRRPKRVVYPGGGAQERSSRLWEPLRPPAHKTISIADPHTSINQHKIPAHAPARATRPPASRAWNVMNPCMTPGTSSTAVGTPAPRSRSAYLRPRDECGFRRVGAHTRNAHAYRAAYGEGGCMKHTDTHMSSDTARRNPHQAHERTTTKRRLTGVKHARRQTHERTTTNRSAVGVKHGRCQARRGGIRITREGW